MIWPLLVLSISLVSSIDGQKLHEHMTKDEIQSVFNCNHDVVHELDYQVVSIFHKDNDEHSRKRTRSKPIVHLRAFEQNYTLYLEENDHILLGTNTPLFIAKPSSNARRSIDEPDIVYSQIQYPLPANFKLYHDMQNRAALTVHKDSDDKVHVNGIVGDDIVIRPLPARVHEEVIPSLLPKSEFIIKSTDSFGDDPFADIPFIDDDPFFNSPFLSGSHQQTHHVVIRPSQNKMNPSSDPIENQWNQKKQQWIDHQDNPFINWQHHQHQSWYPPTRPPFSWRPSNSQPSTQHPAPLPTRRPTPWRPAMTHEPFTWSPLPTRQPATWRPATTKEPMIQRPTALPTITRPLANEDTVYPQLLVAVDYETYTTHGKDIEAVAKYMAAFWNAVDLRYREMSNPKIRLNIAGLIVPQQPRGASYMEKNRVGTDAVLANETLRDIGKYFANEKKFPDTMYDIVVGVAHRNLGAYGSDGKFINAITGIATFEGVCFTKYGQSVALVRDKGGFNGITTAAHELAHTMGAPHDGDESARVPGGPCSWNDGYLMSYERKNSKGMHWSKCSMTAMRMFLKGKSAQCLKNKPDAGTPYPKVLPGRLLSRDEQCKRSMGMVSFKDREDDCATLWCARYTDTEVSYGTQYRPPAEGTYCGEGAICLDAECVKDPEASH